MRSCVLRTVLLTLAVASGLDALAQTVPENSPLMIRSVAGRDLFEFYCATCHGGDGKGKGPVTPVLKIPPPDLTELAQRNGGSFPSQRVETFITYGGDVLTPSHGSSDMPVWGPIFRGLDPSDTRVKVRIANLVKYIESIQRK